MSETIFIDEPTAPQSDVVVDLGTASKQTRGSSAIFGFLDGGLNWPFIFVYR